MPVRKTANKPRKLASIGVHARDWVTWHGFALNVTTDLRYFDLMVPCGIADVTMTSVARELDSGSIELRAVAEAVGVAFGSVFDLTLRPVAPIELLASSELADVVGSLPR